MAHSYKISDKALHGVTEQLGEHLHHLGDPDLLKAKSVELCETFEMWKLGAKALASGAQSGSDLAQLARPTRNLHHQIKHDGEAKSFASSAGDSKNRTLAGWTISPLAKKIDQAVRWIDHQVEIGGDPLVRLLVVPSYHVHAFWLVGEAGSEDRAVVIDAPAQYKGLPRMKLLTSREFLAALVSERQAIGIYE